MFTFILFFALFVFVAWSLIKLFPNAEVITVASTATFVGKSATTTGRLVMAGRYYADDYASTIKVDAQKWDNSLLATGEDAWKSGQRRGIAAHKFVGGTNLDDLALTAIKKYSK